MFHGVVKLWPGRSDRQNSELADAITRDLMKVLGYSEDAASVGFEEVDAYDWAVQLCGPEIRDKWDQSFKKPGYEM